MIRKILYLIVLGFYSSTAFCQFYPFDSIPDRLRKGADAVVRTDQCLYTISGPANAVMKIRKAITLLNENATSYRYLMVPYDKYSKVSNLKGSVYDEKGNIVKSLGLQDIFDMSAIMGGAFYSDSRMKLMYFPVFKYPYTIEFEYELSFTSIFDYPNWYFQEDRDVSVEKSGIQVIVPDDMKLRYYESSLKNKVDSIIQPGRKIYTWMEYDIPARPIRASMLMETYKPPVLYISPLDFEFAGFSGSMKSWKTFGDWIFRINANRDKLPDQDVNAVKALAVKYPVKRDLVKAVYEYMQSRTRYVSIQIGIGGYQTAEASDVSRTGFGDCKALVNYTQALLKQVGVKSIYTLVRAGEYEDDINTGFVSNQFNHAILCVPMDKDTIWLECTNQTIPFNYLGTFTCDRHVLLVTEEGGKLGLTPGFKDKMNTVSRTGSVYINILGASSTSLSTTYTGYNFDFATSELSLESESEMKRSLYNSLGYPDFTVVTAAYSENKSDDPTAVFQYKLDVRDFGSANGERICFNPSLVSRPFLPEESYSIDIAYTQNLVDSLGYFLPPGYEVESLPRNRDILSDFGTFKCTYRTGGDKILVTRKFIMKNGLIPAERYKEFRTFYNSVASSDREYAIIRKSSRK
ncbi:MAG: DUF3857 domain-containing protein [Bacteroidales bacterium]